MSRRGKMTKPGAFSFFLGGSHSGLPPSNIIIIIITTDRT